MTLASGTLFSSCQTRLRDAVVGGSRGFFATLLDPTAVIDLLDLFPDEDE